MNKPTNDPNWLKVLEAVSRADEVPLCELSGETLLTPGELRLSLDELKARGFTAVKDKGQKALPMVGITEEGRRTLAFLKRHGGRLGQVSAAPSRVAI